MVSSSSAMAMRVSPSRTVWTSNAGVGGGVGANGRVGTKVDGCGAVVASAAGVATGAGEAPGWVHAAIAATSTTAGRPARRRPARRRPAGGPAVRPVSLRMPRS